MSMYRTDISMRYTYVVQLGSIMLPASRESVAIIMAKRSSVLEFAVLGLLHDNALHGYELRKQLSQMLGTFRSISYGSLYPCLKDLLAAGYLTTDTPLPTDTVSRQSRRARIVYRLTAEGKERFTEMAEQAGPEAWDDESFGVHLAFFARTDQDSRMRILQGRRSRLEERISNLRESFTQTGQRIDEYTQALHEYGLDSVEREVRWLTELIESEQNDRKAVSAEIKNEGEE